MCCGEEISWVINLTSFQFILSRVQLNKLLSRIIELLWLEETSEDWLVLWSEQGHLAHIAQDCAQWAFEYLQG